MERGLFQEHRLVRSVSEAGDGRVHVVEAIDHPTADDLSRFAFRDGDFVMRRQDVIGGLDFFARSITRERGQVPQELLAEIKSE
jgi:hypothetical protein